MANHVSILLTKAPLACDGMAIVDLVIGALVEFRGIVRRWEGDHEITGIEYEAHAEMAEHQMNAIAQAAADRFQLDGVTLQHRYGFVAVGEPSLYLCVASKHRGAAFEASQWIVDELKRRVPIWKQAKIDNRDLENKTAAAAK